MRHKKTRRTDVVLLGFSTPAAGESDVVEMIATNRVPTTTGIHTYTSTHTRQVVDIPLPEHKGQRDVTDTNNQDTRSLTAKQNRMKTE